MKNVVLYIISKFPRGIGRTRLMKLAFIIDSVSLRKRGKRVFGGEWVRWYFGPFNKAILDALDDLLRIELVDIVPTPASVRYVSLGNPRSLPDDVRGIVDEVIEEYGFKPLNELLDEVYGKWGIKKIPLGEVIEL